MQVVDLAANPQVEVCWYFPTSREQYRLSGTAHIIDAGHADQQLLQARQQAWAAMSDAGEACTAVLSCCEVQVGQQRLTRWA